MNLKDRTTIAIIPAKGQSERLPHKNLKTLGGIPLFVHSINYAKMFPSIIDKIVVSSDDPSILEIAKEHSVTAINRPPALSLSTSTTVSAIKHVLGVLPENIENIILLQPTNPLRPADLLENAFRSYIKSGSDSLITLSRSYRKLVKIENKVIEPFNYQYGQRSQDMKPLYFENGLLYISKAKNILKDKIIGEKCSPFIVDHPFSEIDIDTQEEFEYAEYIFKKFFK